MTVLAGRSLRRRFSRSVIFVRLFALAVGWPLLRVRRLPLVHRPRGPRGEDALRGHRLDLLEETFLAQEVVEVAAGMTLVHSGRGRAAPSLGGRWAGVAVVRLPQGAQLNSPRACKNW